MTAARPEKPECFRGIKMVPIILAGAAAARMAATPIARMLIRQGAAREASRTAAKKIIEKPITHVSQLPKNLQPKTKTPSSVGSRPGARTAKEGKALKERTQKNRQQIKETAPKSKASPSVPKRIRRGAEEQAKIEQQIAYQSAQKLRGAEQARGAVKTVPKSQKGMRLPAKGETVKRRKGGMARKTRVF
jgi:hypothetical protein